MTADPKLESTEPLALQQAPQPRNIEFHVLQGNASVPLMGTHTTGPDDKTPLQLVSDELLAYYQNLDRAMRVFLTHSQIDQVRAAAGYTSGQNQTVTAEK